MKAIEIPNGREEKALQRRGGKMKKLRGQKRKEPEEKNRPKLKLSRIRQF
jgi:hypothetical protein